jgi:wyosine [tRNA(Phe)-imidazoG37] synthetase (radical SAM superfamily)
MATFLFDKIIFGPVNSRRLGISLGINLLPTNYKLCNFDCIYCECGFTPDEVNYTGGFYSRAEVYRALESKLSTAKRNSEKLDSITFAGNGEPTLHPEFCGIIDDTVELRNLYYPGTKISVLSNSSALNNDLIVNALKKIENVILKLDSGIEKTINLINNPFFDFKISDLIDNLKKFENKFIIQSLFLKGKINDQFIDNTTEEEVNEWLKLLKIINPRLVMIYTFARNTPSPNLEKAPVSKMLEIAERVKELGIEAEVFE